MKIIKSKLYMSMRKRAIWSKMPVEDPNLPGQLAEKDIVGGPEEDVTSNQQGESMLDDASLYYTYDYDYNKNEATNIRPTKSESTVNGGVITDPYELDMLVESNEEKIKNDIEIAQESAKIKRSPEYGQPEYDPVDQYESIGF
jgi:hypothetical protein